MEKQTRTHRLAVKNSVGEWKSIGAIIADAQTAIIINGLIAQNKLCIVLDAEIDVNRLINLKVTNKDGSPKLNNFPAIFSTDPAFKRTKTVLDDDADSVVQIKPVVEKQSATEIPF